MFEWPLERQRFTRGPPIQVGAYTVHFLPHDEVVNVSGVDVDTEVWLMLMCYLLDCRSFAAVAKSISSFALLKHIHEPEMLARLIVKAVLHDDSRIPPNVVVSLGARLGTKSWTCPVYVLSRQDIVVPQYEQLVPPNGLAHPIPPEASGWPGQMQPLPAPAQNHEASIEEALDNADAGQDTLEEEMQFNEVQSNDSVEDIDLPDNYVPIMEEGNMDLLGNQQQNLIRNDDHAAPRFDLMLVPSAARALRQPEDQVRLNSIFNKLPSICPDQSIIVASLISSTIWMLPSHHIWMILLT